MMFGATMRMIGFDRRPRLGRTATLSALEGVVAAMIQGSLLVVVYQTVSGSFDARSLAVMLAGIALGLALRWYLGSRAMLSCQITGAEFIKEARMAIGERLRRVPLGFFQKHRAGDLTSRLMANLQDVETILTHLYPEIVTSLVNSVLVAVCLFVVDWRLALVALAFLPLAIPLVVFTNRLFAGAGRRRYTVNGEMNDAFVEFLAGIRTLKAHDMALEKLEHLKGLIDESKRVSLKVEFLGALILGPFQAFLDLGLALVLLVGITFLTGGSLSTADFVAVALLSFFLYKPIKVLSQEQAELRNAEEAARTIAAIVDEPGQSWGEEGFRPRDVSLVFENVSFSYDGRSEALRDVSFAVPAGRVVALVGPSGSGKTTAANLAMRLWDPDRGRIIFSGRDIATIRPEELLANVGVVFQDVYLFHDTVRANIGIAKEGATEEEIRAAAVAANADEFIRRLPRGYDTVLAEGGASLSGGEKQRIAIARCLLKGAPFVILDEATASLDPENERDIQEALARLLERKTVLVIAHRLRTIQSADGIVVLDGGRAVERGTHEELLALDGCYARMWRNQEESEGWLLKR